MVTIKVTGPGGTISFEMLLIQELLEREGYKVVVQDDHPFSGRKNSEFKTKEEYFEHRRKLMAEKPREIVLEADHQPWGG